MHGMTKIGERLRAQPSRRLSEVFEDLSRDGGGPVSIAAVRDACGDRSFAALLAFFAAINMLPLPPGTSLVLGIPLLIVSIQMLSARDKVWLPDFVLNKTFTAEQFAKFAGRAVPWLRWLEKLVQPRWWPFADKQDDRVIGAIALLMGICVTLPIPLGNWLPSFASALLGLALLERDGLLLVAGIAVAIIALAVIGLVVSAAGVATHAVLGWMM